MKKLTLTGILLLGTLFITQAQSPSWQWGIRGGGPWTSGGGGVDESVVDMATDPHGNVYVLSYVQTGLSGTGVNVDGHAVTGWGSEDWLISSFTCSGAFRWTKDIGGSDEDIPVAIKTDTLGGVYVIGNVFLSLSSGHIDADTIVGTTNQAILEIKFDTAGNYKWLSFPQSDTVGEGTFGNTFPYDMDVDGGGNSYILGELSPGAYAGGAYLVSTQGEYMLEYDKNGNFISGNPMQTTVTGFLTGSPSPDLLMTRDAQNGKFYITGSVNGSTLSFGSTPITHALYVGCFSSTGAFLWQKQDVLYDGGFGRPDIDASGNIYLTSISTIGDTFNTFAVSAGIYGEPLITKMDSAGAFMWGRVALTNGGTGCSAYAGGARRCSILNGSEIDISGEYGGLLKWPGSPDSLNIPYHGSGGYCIYITRFDITTGAVTGIDSIGSPFGTNDDQNAMAVDKFGNFYVGGDFGSAIWVDGDTMYTAGGNSDFFFAKYGTANCDSVPGTIDSTALHIASVQPEYISVYPNPATEELNITGVTQTTAYQLLSVTGTVVQQGKLTPGPNIIQMANYAPGLYILEMTGADGTRNVVRVAKE